MIKLPSGVDINNLIDDLRIFSWEAADILLFYSKIIRDKNSSINIIKNKQNDEPVTLADLKVNETIINRINGKYKNIDWEILSEENVKKNCSFENRNRDWLWVLDPLDGTKDFIQGTGNYAMHLALNYKNVPFIGVVMIPEIDELWITNGNVTWCENRGGNIKFKQVPKKFNLNEMSLVTSKNHRNHKLRELIEKITFQKVVVMGSIGCKVASIIRGDCDIYISLSLSGQTSPKDWDFAAPDAILRSAGGLITNLENEELKYNKNSLEQSGIIVATRDRTIHGSICKEIKEITKKYNIVTF